MFLGCAISAAAQSSWQPGHAGIGFSQPQLKQWVQMVSSPDFSISASSHSSAPQALPVRFVIQTGLHINSHTPHSPYLIPTTLTLDQPAGIKIARVEYPVGMDYRFQFSPKDPLSVYTGEFGLLVQVHAPPGHYILHGLLHYQACDNRACNPPKSLPVTLNVTAN